MRTITLEREDLASNLEEADVRFISHLNKGNARL